MELRVRLFGSLEEEKKNFLIIDILFPKNLFCFLVFWFFQIFRSNIYGFYGSNIRYQFDLINICQAIFLQIKT